MYSVGLSLKICTDVEVILKVGQSSDSWFVLCLECWFVAGSATGSLREWAGDAHRGSQQARIFTIKLLINDMRNSCRLRNLNNKIKFLDNAQTKFQKFYNFYEQSHLQQSKIRIFKNLIKIAINTMSDSSDRELQSYILTPFKKKEKPQIKFVPPSPNIMCSSQKYRKIYEQLEILTQEQLKNQKNKQPYKLKLKTLCKKSYGLFYKVQMQYKVKKNYYNVKIQNLENIFSQNLIEYPILEQLQLQLQLSQYRFGQELYQNLYNMMETIKQKHQTRKKKGQLLNNELSMEDQSEQLLNNEFPIEPQYEQQWSDESSALLKKQD